MEIITGFINYISEKLIWFQLVSFFISGILLGFIIYYLLKINFLKENVEYFFDVLGAKDIPRRRTLKAWKQIQKRLKMRETNQLKLAILEADRILNEILKMAGYQGKTIDERLQQITSAQLSNIEEIKQARKIRSRIANEPDFIITPNEAEIAIDIYRKAFQELNLIRD